jgi:hypothetical protein
MHGALAPHAPLLVEELRSAETRAAGDAIETAVRDLQWDAVDLCVLVSPHGPSSGVYEEVRGSLRDFGASGAERNWTGDLDVAKRLAESWDRPLLSGPVDYGVLVPLFLGGVTAEKPIVGVTLAEADLRDRLSWHRLHEDVLALDAALQSLDSSTRALVVASCNTSLALSPRAPLTELPDVQGTEEQLLAALEGPLGDLSARHLLETIWSQGSCAPGPLLLLSSLFPRARLRAVTYRAPVGVGYLVGRIDD